MVKDNTLKISGVEFGDSKFSGSLSYTIGEGSLTINFKSCSVHYANVMSMERLMDIQKTNPFSLDIIWSGSVEIVNIRPVTQKDGTRRFVEYRFGTYIKPDHEKIGNNVVIDKTLAKMIGLDEEDRALPFKRICRKVRSITTIEHYPNDQPVIS